MTNAMKTATQAIAKMNKSTDIQKLQKIMMEFSKQNEMMDMKQEMVDDAMDMVFEEDGDEEATDQIVNQVQ